MGDIFISSVHEKVLKVIAAYGYITVDEVAIITNDRKRAFNVLSYMYQKGFLGTMATRLMPTKAYYLPEDMRRILESSGRVSYVKKFFPYLYKPTGFYHHISTIKVQLYFEKILAGRLVEWITEPQLKERRQEKICDGEMIFVNKKSEQKRAGIEIELTLKSAFPRARRMKGLFEYARTKLDTIIMFYNNEIIKKRMVETIKARQQESDKPIFFIFLNDFYKDGAECFAETLNGEKIQIFK